MRSALIVAVVLTALAGFLDIYMFFGIRRDNALSKHGVRAMARVVSIDDPEAPHPLVYEYLVEGELHRVSSSCEAVCPSPGAEPEVGSEIAIVYLPEEPTFSRPVQEVGTISLRRFLGCMGCVATPLANIGALVAWGVIFRRRGGG